MEEPVYGPSVSVRYVPSVNDVLLPLGPLCYSRRLLRPTRAARNVNDPCFMTTDCDSSACVSHDLWGACLWMAGSMARVALGFSDVIFFDGNGSITILV